MKNYKVCRHCKKNKYRSKFSYKPNGKLCPFCKECFPKIKHTLASQQKEYKVKKWLKKNKVYLTLKTEYKDRLVEMFGGCCNICGYDKCARGLHFHHKNPKDKLFSISSPPDKNMLFEEILQEAQKCVLLCANCHAEVHARISKI